MMTIAKRRLAGFALLMVTATFAGCVHRSPEAAPPPLLAPADHARALDAIVALLDTGDTAAASPRIDALLRRDPADPAARVLRDSIDRDPVALLGPKSFAYAVKPGETMLGLSTRFLGNRLKSYQLARYNRIAVPAGLTAGTVLHIPGIPPRDDEAGSGPAPRPRPVRRIKPDIRAPRSDFAGAGRARAAGLAALGQGRIGAALAALRRAALLAPTDPLIQRDLARAERIAATAP